MVQISHPFIITGNKIAPTIPTFVGKVMSLLFNTLTRFVIAIFSRNKHLFNFMAVVTICSDLEPKKIKSVIFPLFPKQFAMK